MYNKIKVTTIFHLALLLVNSNTQITRRHSAARGVFTDTRRDARFKTKVLMILNIGEPAKCLIQCLNHVQCKAINIHLTKQKCELLENSIADNSDGTDKVEKNNGWIYYGPKKVCLYFLEFQC